VRFGVTLVQVVEYAALRDDLLFAESLGLDNAWVIDQFGIDEAPEIPLLEAWTLLAALATGSSSIRLGTLVTNVAMRNPGVLAQSILTVDQISNGRIEAAVGGGFYPTEHTALGIDFPAPGDRTTRLREAVAILDRALRGETVSHDGEHFRMRDATFRPVPTQQPRPPLWVAAQASNSLRIAVDHAEGLVTLGAQDRPMDESLPAFRARMRRVDELCEEAGRDPNTLRRCYFSGWADEPIFASIEATTDLIGGYVEAGATDFTFYLHSPGDPVMESFVSAHRAATRDQLERSVAEVFPRFR